MFWVCCIVSKNRTETLASYIKNTKWLFKVRRSYIILKMAVVIVEDKVTAKDLEEASEEYGEYIKVVCDVETGALAIGGEWHADSEKALLGLGSKQGNLWGGGVDLANKNVECVALINIRPDVGNNSQEILDEKTREKFRNIVKEKFEF